MTIDFAVGDVYIDDDYNWFLVDAVTEKEVRVAWWAGQSARYLLGELSTRVKNMVKTTREAVGLIKQIRDNLHRADLETLKAIAEMLETAGKE